MAKLNLADAARIRDTMRRAAGSFVVDGFFRGISRAGRLHPRANPERHQVEVIADLPYRDSGLVEHTLDIYRPKARPGPYPIVLYVHGGGFRILSKDSHWLMGLIFARRGYLVFNISYRLAPKHAYPCAVEDACSALEWVAANAERWGGDPTRIVLAGESAGANLVSSLAIALAYRRREEFADRVFQLGIAPRAVVPACGMLQVSNCERFKSGQYGRLAAFYYDRITEVSGAYLLGCDQLAEDALDLADPLVVFERAHKPERPLPPFFAPVGTKDPIAEDTRRLKRALDRMGVVCEAPEYEGEHHAFHAMIWKKNAIQCWRDTFDFLGRHVPGTADFSDPET